MIQFIYGFLIGGGICAIILLSYVVAKTESQATRFFALCGISFNLFFLLINIISIFINHIL